MTWNEAEHPRDELGRFTFKNGGRDDENNNQTTSPFKLKAEMNVFKEKKEKNDKAARTPGYILYGKTRKQEKDENIYRNILLNTLGNLATPAMILYKNTKDLEKIVKENGLWDKLKEKTRDYIINPTLQPLTQKIIGENYNKATRRLAIALSGVDTAGMLNLAHGEENIHSSEYIKDAIKLENYNDSSIKEDREYLKEKIETQFRDYKYNVKNIKGYNFKENSKPSQRIAQNKDFQDILAKNKENILSNKNFSISFPKHGPFGIMRDNNLKNALGKADVKIKGIDKQGNLHLKIYDTYDFNKNAKDFLNKAGREEMEKGNLKPFFTIHDILIPKEQFDIILNKG